MVRSAIPFEREMNRDARIGGHCAHEFLKQVVVEIRSRSGWQGHIYRRVRASADVDRAGSASSIGITALP